MASGHKRIAADNDRHDVRMDGVFFFRTAMNAPFVKALDPGNFSYCVMVRSGGVRLETDFPTRMEVELCEGDAVAVSGLAPHTIASLAAPKRRDPDRFEQQPMTREPTLPGVDLVIGVAPNEALALGSLMMGPIIIRAAEQPDLSRRLWRAVEMLEDEYGDESWIDRNLVIRRLAEIVLVNMSRAYLAQHQAASYAPAPEVANRQVLRAVTAFFAAPEKAWTLPDLAKAAGMSRTRFAESFKAVTGQTPKRIISRMRLTAIARKLASAALSVETAAAEAGYGSSAAFVRAFQREFGETPARWRRMRRGAEASPPQATARRARKQSRKTRREAR
jgi:AraC-like DNA-binding protein